VVACPYGTLNLADLAGPGAAGLPWFAPRNTACAMCPDLPCVKACPTGALDPRLDDIAKARMGLAVIDAEHCLSWQGLRCEVCYRVCPVRGTAIRIDPHPRVISKHAVFVPVVSADACTGCGLCENACPTEVAAIRVLRASFVQGRIGEHYRVGGKDGGALPTDAAADARPALPSGAPADEAVGAASPTKSPPGTLPAPGLDYLNRSGPP
jgi:ferredoxin-type protein NapG